jgi:hypothetical protein
MKVIEEGHIYVVDNVELPHSFGQPVRFIKKEVKTAYDGSEKLVTVQDGTTNEELLKVVSHRLGTLNRKLPCQENEEAIKKITEAIELLELRTKTRVSRGVEGSMKP